MLKPLPPPWDRFVPFLQKIFVWALFFSILWFLRQFFLLVFLTFVFGYILDHVVEKLDGTIRSRRVRVLIGFFGLLVVLVGLGLTVGPDLKDQAQQVPAMLRKHLGGLDEKIHKLRESSETAAKLLPADLRAGDLLTQALGLEQTPVPKPDGEPERRLSILPLVMSIAGRTLTIGGAFLLSLLFSFLIVLDLPNLARGVKHLHDTRLRFLYDEVSDSIFHFGRTLGRALEAQLMIAIVNTGFTAIGLWWMDLGNRSFLSAIVFICSFIPVAGVWISSVPICLAALTKDPATGGGFGLMGWAIAFISVIHMIEAYILNPRIYGAHLRINPVVVLAILVMSQHLFGVWGLVLGVPVISYFFQHVIAGRKDSVAPVESGAG